MPLPFALSHINLWAIKDNDGWALVDTGSQTEETAAAWSSLFAGPLNDLKSTRVLVMHMHSDHVGMAGWLTRKFDCRLWMTCLGVPELPYACRRHRPRGAARRSSFLPARRVE